MALNGRDAVVSLSNVSVKTPLVACGTSAMVCTSLAPATWPISSSTTGKPVNPPPLTDINR